MLTTNNPHYSNITTTTVYVSSSAKYSTNKKIRISISVWLFWWLVRSVPGLTQIVKVFICVWTCTPLYPVENAIDWC
jgi:hypothetical protein